jgi:hypothetical protein
MTEDVIEESADVPFPPQRISDENNCPISDSCVYGVLVHNATKTFGSGSKKCSILQGLNLSVKRGSM